MAAMAMNAVGAAVSILGNKHESSTSTTKSAIGSNIQLTTKTGEIPTALSRDTDNANQKVQQYDLAKVQENQEIASLAGQIGATAVGDLAKAMKWEDGSPQKIALHGLVGYLSAQLSGGNGTAGAAAGMTTEWLNTQVENYLLQQEAKGELSDDSRKAIQQASSALIGAATGAVIGGNRETAAQGATTALNAEKFNRQLHETEKKRILALAQGDKEKQVRLEAAACALVHCSAQIPADDHEYAEQYAAAKALEELGNTPEFASERELLSHQYEFHGGYDDGAEKLFEYSIFSKIRDADDANTQIITRASGALQTAGGVAIAVAGAGLCDTGVGCIAGSGLATYGTDQASAGLQTTYTGKYTSTVGAKLLSELTGLSPEMSELLYGVVPVGAGSKLPSLLTGSNKLPVVGKTVGYENATVRISTGAENNAKAVPLKEQLSNEVLKSQGTKLDDLVVSARAEINGKVYIDTNQNARSPTLANPNKPTLISQEIANKPPARNGTAYPNANMADAHAEIGAIQQAYENGITQGKDMVIHVQGRDVCTYCRNDIATAAKKAGLRSVTVHAVNKEGKPVIYDWDATMKSIKLRKE